MKTSIPRLSSVKLKGGAKLHLIRNTMAEECDRAFASDCAEFRSFQSGRMAGFAIVAWGVDGRISTSVRIRDSRQVGRGMVPDFVRSQLIEHLATE